MREACQNITILPRVNDGGTSMSAEQARSREPQDAVAGAIQFKKVRWSDAALPRHAEYHRGLREKELSLLASPTDSISASTIYVFGNHHDGVIEFAALTRDGGAIETGYYYGDEKPKSIIKVSSQVGCPYRCHFCNAGEEVFKRNLTPDEIYQQAALMLKVAAGQGVPWSTLAHKINFAGTGEPLLNPGIVEAVRMLSEHELSIKVSSVFPGGSAALTNFSRLAEFAGSYSGSIQFQLSLISTDAHYRNQVTGGKVASFDEIVRAAQLWRKHSPQRSQINLSLILTETTPADVERIRSRFPPELFRIRFRNYVPTEFGKTNQLVEISDERMQRVKEEFRLSGYVVRDDATPTVTEQAFSLASNVTRRSMMAEMGLPIALKQERRGSAE